MKRKSRKPIYEPRFKENSNLKLMATQTRFNRLSEGTWVVQKIFVDFISSNFGRPAKSYSNLQKSTEEVVFCLLQTEVHLVLMSGVCFAHTHTWPTRSEEYVSNKSSGSSSMIPINESSRWPIPNSVVWIWTDRGEHWSHRKYEEPFILTSERGLHLNFPNVLLDWELE